jgi:hypothetical protein
MERMDDIPNGTMVKIIDLNSRYKGMFGLVREVMRNDFGNTWYRVEIPNPDPSERTAFTQLPIYSLKVIERMDVKKGDEVVITNPGRGSLADGAKAIVTDIRTDVDITWYTLKFGQREINNFTRDEFRLNREDDVGKYSGVAKEGKINFPETKRAVENALFQCKMSGCKIDVEYNQRHHCIRSYHNGESRTWELPTLLNSPPVDADSSPTMARLIPQIAQWTRERHAANDPMENDWELLRKRRIEIRETFDPLPLERRRR